MTMRGVFVTQIWDHCSLITLSSQPCVHSGLDVCMCVCLLFKARCNNDIPRCICPSPWITHTGFKLGEEEKESNGRGNKKGCTHTYTYSHTACDWYTRWSTSHHVVDIAAHAHTPQAAWFYILLRMLLRITGFKHAYLHKHGSYLYHYASVRASLCTTATHRAKWGSNTFFGGRSKWWSKVAICFCFCIWVWQIILLRVSSVTYMVRGKQSIYTHAFTLTYQNDSLNVMLVARPKKLGWSLIDQHVRFIFTWCCTKIGNADRAIVESGFDFYSWLLPGNSNACKV